MTYAEVAGIHHLYSIAQPGSLLIAGTDGTPWQFQDFEKYDLLVLTDSSPDIVARQDVAAITQIITNEGHPHVYLIFTRSQEATLESTYGLPSGALDRLERVLIASGQYRLIYTNPDAHILLFMDGTSGGAA